MKKIIALLLATLMIICCFASCGKDDTGSAPSSDGTDKTPAFLDYAPQYEDVYKGYINHTTAAEYTITEDENFECTDNFYLNLPKGTVLSSDKEFGIYTYIIDETGTFVLNTNAMSGSGFEVNGFNPKMKTGEAKLTVNCFVRISVKGSLTDVKIKHPEDSVPFAGNKSVVEISKKISVVNDFFIDKGDSVNYLFITDLHNGAFINDPDGDGLRNYDSVADVNARLEARTRVLAQAVALVNTSPYLDFIVAGGDFINGYETTESLTYQAAKKKNPKLTVREHAIDQLQEMLAPLKECKKPVFVLAGNHDDNAGHSLWQSTNHPSDTRVFPEFLISDLDWEREVLSEFLNVEVVRDDSYSFGGKSVSKYYYYDLKKGEKTVRIICLDYDDIRYPFNSSGAVTSANGKGGTYYQDQMKWFAEVALHGDFDECILLSHAPSSASTVLDKIVQSYQNRVSYKNPGINIDTTFANRTSGSITHYHHGHEHEESVLYNNSLRYWTISSDTVSQFDIIAATPDSVYKYHYATGKEIELKREGGKQ